MLQILNQTLQRQRSQMVEIAKNLHQLASDIGNAELSKTISELRDRIHEPFMFVIVGEVKVGKSSFVNALLEADEEITKVAPDPCTDTIQQIVYGERAETVVINPFLKKIFSPNALLKEIAIVDTPGTNTIIEHHQEITERFIPSSDLIVFVFEAKNPYRQSAWAFFDYIHRDWQKKVIFVLQQKDLLNATDLQTNLNGVRKQAEKKGIENPAIFAVSAKTEQEKQPESGFEPLRNFIRSNITGGQAPILKLKNNLQTARNIVRQVETGLTKLSEQYQTDLAFRKDISNTLAEQTQQSEKQVEALCQNMTDAYAAVSLQAEKQLREGLGFFSLFRRTVVSVFSKKESPKNWIDETAAAMSAQLNTALSEKLNNGVTNIAESLQQMVRIVDLKIRNSATVLKEDKHLFSDLAERRATVLKDLQTEFSAFMNDSEQFLDKSLLPDNSEISPNIAAGSGLATIGIVLAAVTQGMVLDITGGILTVLGLAVSGITVASKRKTFFKAYEQATTQGKKAINTEVRRRMTAYISHIREKVEGNFLDFDALLELENKQVEAYTLQHNEVCEQIEALAATV